jgi:phosphotransferase system enzyme I (PtsI)
MQKLQGIAVSPGVAIGEALVMDTEGLHVSRRFIPREAADQELARLDRAIAAASEEIARNRDSVSDELGEKYGAIFEGHLEILHSSKFRGDAEEKIRNLLYTPEYAVTVVMRHFTEVLGRTQSRNVLDLRDIEKRLLRHLLGHRREEFSQLNAPAVVLAHNLTPSEAANLDRRFVLGFVTEIGGPGSHTAIVATALEIPAVVGTGPFLNEVSNGDLLIIDGDRGTVILRPDDEVLAQYRQEAEEIRHQAVRLEELRDLPAVTADGVHVELLGNIEFPYEVQHCIDRGANGVGLYRTEFLYLGAEREPDEEEHFRAYTQVVEAMRPQPVTIRTFDLGADKVPHLPDPEDEHNPFLGLRSIRLSLRHLPMFRTQLRAILRASALGNVRVMFPLISTLQELRHAKMVLADVMEDLDEHGVPYHRAMPVGMMVETPAAVMMIDWFVEEIDFLSLGTNDLIQYTLAVDRSNKDVVGLYNASDPSVLKLIELTIRAAGRKSVPAGLCGQMSASATYTMLLLGMGLRQFSLPPSAIPEIKKICRSVTIAQCEAVARYALTLENARDVKSYLRSELKKCVPDLL